MNHIIDQFDMNHTDCQDRWVAQGGLGLMHDDADQVPWYQNYA